jgi:hypothetical protein
MLSVAVVVALAAAVSAQEPSTRPTESTRFPTRQGEPSRSPEATRPSTRASEFTRPSTRPEGTRPEASEGTRAEGTRAEGTRAEGTRAEGTRAEGTRAEGTRAEGTRAEDRPAGDGDIRANVPECQNLCTLESCRNSTAADCRQQCTAKLQACQTAAAAAVRSRWQEASDDFKQRVEDARERAGDVAKLTLADVKAKCTAACDERAGERATACKAQCDKIGEGAAGKGGEEAAKEAAKVVIGACRDRFEDAVKRSADSDSQEVKDAVAKLKDAVADRRALFDEQRATFASALDDFIAKWKEARQSRQDKIAAARAAFKEFQDKLAAATTDEEKAKIRSDAKAEVQKALDDAKTSRDAAKAAWSDKREALVKSVIEAHKDRRAARRIVIAECKNVKQTIDDVKAAAQGVDPAAQVAATAERKRGTTVTIVVSCDQADESCGQAINNVVSGAVASSADVTYTETTPDEVDYQTPTIDQQQVGKDTTGGVASLALGAVATVAALVVALF